MTDYLVDVEPIGRRITCAPDVDTTLLEVARQAGVLLTAICGGQGTCGRCVVQVLSGQVSPPTRTEESELGEALNKGWRLACQTHVAGDARIYIPPESLVTAQRTQTEGQFIDISMAPAVRKHELHLMQPMGLTDLRSYATRLRDKLCLPGLSFNPRVLSNDVLEDLQANNLRASIFVRGSEVVAVRRLGTPSLGLAVDIGTTKLAAYLVDLESGVTLASAGATNPQIVYGEDVMARISHAIHHAGGGEQLRTAIVNAINDMARELCAQARQDVSNIMDAVIVGNTAMHHLFLGLPVKQLGLAPYVPAEDAAIDIPARDAGLEMAPGAYVHLLPIIAGFVGADHVAMLIATSLPESFGVVLGLDIGTNTEISLHIPNQVLSCSTASGPAFEGAHIRHGMRAAPGAIERVQIRDGRVLVQTVDNAPPVGLCGSGILDLMAQLLRAGIIDSRGAMHADKHPRVRQGEHGPEFVVVTAEENNGREITFSRADIAEIQLAKGAIRAGIRILLKHAGITEADIDRVIIAGAFGTYLDAQSGMDIGMLPRVSRHRIQQVGNAAGAGARMALVSTMQRERAMRIAQYIHYVELTAVPEFQSEFAQALLLEPA